jgi:DNA polymerase I-like protein with 3'-5' exonuclease and polymerase domains
MIRIEFKKLGISLLHHFKTQGQAYSTRREGCRQQGDYNNLFYIILEFKSISAIFRISRYGMYL